MSKHVYITLFRGENPDGTRWRSYWDATTKAEASKQRQEVTATSHKILEVSTVKLPVALWSREDNHVTATFHGTDGKQVFRKGKVFW